MKEKRYVTFDKGTEYSPLAEDARADGMVTRWYARNSSGVAVTWARTKKQAMEEARAMGYSIAR